MNISLSRTICCPHTTVTDSLSLKITVPKYDNSMLSTRRPKMSFSLWLTGSNINITDLRKSARRDIGSSVWWSPVTRS